MPFDLIKLLTDVFDPQAGEIVTVAMDVPHNPGQDTNAWRERRSMALEWHRAFTALGHGRGFTTNPILTYRATRANNADLPREAEVAGQKVALTQTLLASTLAVFLTEYSATAPLDGLCKMKDDFRAASMPGVEKRMERTALAADYREVARRCRILDDTLRGAESLEVTFSTGHHCTFDLRFRRAEVDDGFLPRNKPGDRVINLPSGETFIVPYEGERAGVPSLTSGGIPVREGPELMIMRIEGNRITRLEGNGDRARTLRAFFAADSARTNVAEVAFGCNEWAEVTGNVLEDEKAGFHWAYGRSEHLGGTVGVQAFIQPETVIHQDIVYAKGNPIQVAEAATVYPDGARTRVIRNGNYVVF
jgi:leucyl aminopeptidase (aminopeptidase T)